MLLNRKFKLNKNLSSSRLLKPVVDLALFAFFLDFAGVILACTCVLGYTNKLVYQAPDV